jgi:hypothetical protein
MAARNRHILGQTVRIGTSHYERSAKADDVRPHVHGSRLTAQYEHRMRTLRLIFQLSSTLAQSIVGSVVKLTKERKTVWTLTRQFIAISSIIKATTRIFFSTNFV